MAPVANRVVDLCLSRVTERGARVDHEAYGIQTFDRHEERGLVVRLAWIDRHDSAVEEPANPSHNVQIGHHDANDRRIRLGRRAVQESALALEDTCQPVKGFVLDCVCVTPLNVGVNRTRDWEA